MSTQFEHEPYKSRPYTPTYQQSFGSIAELRQHAYVDKSDTEAYSVKSWINTVIQLYEKADYAMHLNDLENAYINYFRGCSIMTEIVKLHSQYHEVRHDPLFNQLKKRTNEEVIAILNDLATTIQNWYNSTKKQPYNNPYYHPTHAQTAYAYRPSHDPRNFPHYTLSDLPLGNPLHSVAQANRALSKLPVWTNNTFPDRLTVDPLELAQWITTKTNPPSILIVDIRSRDAFKNGCIKYPWIMQMEPFVLQSECSIVLVQDSLKQHPETEQMLFQERARFDLIVFYDQSSRTIETADHSLQCFWRLMNREQLRRRPMMLAGGFDAWFAKIGERGVHRFPRDKKTWFRQSTSSNGSSVYSENGYHSLYDYFTGKKQVQPVELPLHSIQHDYMDPIIRPEPLPTAPRKESITTRHPEVSSPTTETAPALPEAVAYPQLSSQLQVSSMPLPKNSIQQDVRPVPPSYPKLHRRRTFIDNPFNGFTTTTSKLYDVPPIAFQHQQQQLESLGHSFGALSVSSPKLKGTQRPSSTEPVVSVSRPSTLSEFQHVSTNNIHCSPNDNTFSQLNTVVSIGCTGLKNLGNTCYMNSIVQCLSGTIPLARYLMSGMFKQHINRHNKIGSGGVLVENFAEVVRVMWSENYRFISPMTFRESLIRFAPRFSGKDQHDSQEFLMVLLDGLHEDLNAHGTNNRARPSSLSLMDDDLKFEKLPDWQASGIAWERYLGKNSSIIVSLFQGQYRSRLTCLSCKQTSTTYNAFMSLSLPIPTKKLRLSSATLYQCLDYFVKEETLEKEDAWQCPKCLKKRKASKQLTLTRLPDILLIHLKRFSMDGLFRNKLDTFVKCPTRSLDLSEYVPSSMTAPTGQDRSAFVYDLYAVSNHYGSLTGGHYTACVRDGYKDKWNYFDDSKVSICDESKVVTKAAYNLFYVRSRVK
ncbi:hypothetical protein EDC96DRAFT_571317 [Choanephora cucurbitarum]|nr:hypothetical protein EDC96DRAFT_571317 [Choanephora cucurbitarum]